MPYKRTIGFKDQTLTVSYEFCEGVKLILLDVEPDISEADADELYALVRHTHDEEEEAYWRKLYDGEVQAGLAGRDD